MTIVSSCRYNYGGLFAALVILTVTITPRYSKADELGRLFTTPQERQFINQYRSHYERMSEEELALFKGIDPAEVQSPVATSEQAVTVNGLVQRSKGPQTVWINGQGTQKSGKLTNTGVKLRGGINIDQSLSVKPKGGKQFIRLKPGQVWDPERKKVLELYQVKTAPLSAGQTKAEESAGAAAQ